MVASRAATWTAWAAAKARTLPAPAAGIDTIDAIVVRWLPSPPPVTINGAEYDLSDETTRALIALLETAGAAA